MTLANWLVDRKAPTTARVFVNRVWQAYFGTGIVATAEDFGMQSEKRRPSGPGEKLVEMAESSSDKYAYEKQNCREVWRPKGIGASRANPVRHSVAGNERGR